MTTTLTVSASMRTRKATLSSNYKSSAASQEFYTDDYNFVGIVNFPGLNLANKVITQIKLKVTAAEAGYGAGTTKTVYVRESKYQAASQSGITGGNYYGPALGTFTGSFYGNTTTTTLSSALFTNLATYLAAGNNTICLFNLNATRAGGQTYSYNYLQWDSCQIIITYEEAASVPTTSPTSVALGSAVTISTNRLSTSATHTLKYSFGSSTGTIATDVGDTVSWTPPISLASQIPSATSGVCTITCETYYNGVLTGTKTCQLTLTVPSSVVPTILSVTHTESVSGLAAQFAAYVQGKSKLNVSISATGAYGSTITTYRATLDGVTFTAASFTTGFLLFSGTKALSVTVTDSRGRTATTSANVTVVAYTPPSISAFSAERCNADGSAAQQDGTKVRVNLTAGAASVGAKNTMTCAVYYKLSSASAWTLAQSVSPVSYGVSKTNLLLSPSFNALSSYDIKVAVTDFLTASTPVEQEVSVSTKQVMQDFYRDGTGVAFGKVAETPNAAEFAWKLVASDAQIDTMRMKTYTSVAQLGQTVGSATINGCRGAMSDGSLLMAQASDFASAELPSTIGTILLGRIHTIRSFCLFMGKEPATGVFKQALDSAGTSFTGTWYRVYDSATVVPISAGGSGQTSAAGIRNAIGLGNTTGALPVANGGTGATNVAGAVSALGLTGALVVSASGNSGNHHYLRFSNGLQVCYGTHSWSTAMTTSLGSIYLTDTHGSFSFPVAFTSVISATGTKRGSVANSGLYRMNASTTGLSGIAMFRGNSASATALQEVDYIVLGKWK